MVKKIFMLLVCIFALQTAVRADDDKPIQVKHLPERAQQFIKRHFADCKVAIAKMESSFFDKSYDIIFTNGNKVEFNKQGNWTEVDCKYGTVPAGIVPIAIRNYVSANYPEAKILKIERENREYEVKLSNRWELKFDSSFHLIDLDN